VQSIAINFGIRSNSVFQDVNSDLTRIALSENLYNANLVLSVKKICIKLIKPILEARLMFAVIESSAGPSGTSWPDSRDN